MGIPLLMYTEPQQSVSNLENRSNKTTNEKGLMIQ